MQEDLSNQIAIIGQRVIKDISPDAKFVSGFQAAEEAYEAALRSHGVTVTDEELKEGFNFLRKTADLTTRVNEADKQNGATTEVQMYSVLGNSEEGDRERYRDGINPRDKYLVDLTNTFLTMIDLATPDHEQTKEDLLTELVGYVRSLNENAGAIKRTEHNLVTKPALNEVAGLLDIDLATLLKNRQK
jgi:hypothetical protein